MRQFYFKSVAVFAAVAVAVSLSKVVGAATLPYLAEFSTDGVFDGIGIETTDGGELVAMSVSGGTLNIDTTAETTADSGAHRYFGLAEVTGTSGKVIQVSGEFSQSLMVDPNSDVGFLSFKTSTSGFSGGGYLTDYKPDGSFRIYEIGNTIIASAPAGTFSYDENETYTLTLTATPIIGGVDDGKLDLTFAIDDPSEAGPVSINAVSALPAATGDYFGIYTRVGSGFVDENIIGTYDNISVTEIPEPSTLALLLGMACPLLSLRALRTNLKAYTTK